MNPLVSVIIPTYNHAHFLGDALQSVLDQKYDNLEIFVIDNHSLDNTDEVVSSFQDERIKLLKIHNNGIIAASRNMGIKLAKGDWIAFLDSDDVWYNTKLRTIIEFLKSEKYDVVSTDELMVDTLTGKKRVLRHGPYVKNFYKTMLFYGNRLSTSATVVRRSFLINNNLLFSEDTNLVTVEDYDLWMKLALLLAKFKFIHKIEGEYIIHGENCSGNVELHKNNLLILINKHLLDLKITKLQKYKILRNIRNSLLLKEFFLDKKLYLAINMVFSIQYRWLVKVLLIRLSVLCKKILRLY
mgnify:CR=1 FL=1|jgi:glycosyltransferase involved in cell wall biosynthesis